MLLLLETTSDCNECGRSLDPVPGPYVTLLSFPFLLYWTDDNLATLVWDLSIVSSKQSLLIFGTLYVKSDGFATESFGDVARDERLILLE